MTQRKRIDIAIDLETLSTSREHLPAVVEIGAVVFDRSLPADECVTAFVTANTVPSMAEAGGYSDQATRDCLADERPILSAGGNYNCNGPWEMLWRLSAWLESVDARSPDDATWWAWGAEFDMRILQGLVERAGVAGDFPIHYRHVRDARTYCTELSEQFGIVLPKQDPDTKHHAVKDAAHCARLVTGVTQSMEVIREMAESREVVA
ncbi:3'-5' exoribonuclease [Guyparkeria sp. GHLCS8-2]|uniref:3'-5' exoribonuclease domain-containing protein n=1 Tax=Guyparkeria halopsychrophila TaxID=3139421 RepID=UPI0037CC5F33